MIATTLVAHFYVNHIHPWVWVTAHGDQYYDAAKQCHEAATELNTWQSMQEHLDLGERDGFRRTSTVAMMDCYERAQLRLDMLSKGVQRTELDRIDLLANRDSSAGSLYLVEGLRAAK